MVGLRLPFGFVQGVFLLLILWSTIVPGMKYVMSSEWSKYTSVHAGAAFIAFYAGLTVLVVKLGRKKQPTLQQGSVAKATV